MELRPPTISFLTQIYFDAGAAAWCGELLEEFSMKRPFIVTDKRVVAAGLVERLKLDRPIVFDDVETNPSASSAYTGTARFRQQQCDGIVAIGGGSPIDCAKTIALLVHHLLPLAQYAFINGGMGRITSDLPPVIAVPTTAGTGSEVGRAALIKFNDGRKLGLLSPHLIPKAAICDPTLTLGLPGRLTAATGMDAVSHCIETFLSPRYNPVAEAIALDGLVRACVNLPRAVENGSNLDVRREMMMAALQGGLTFQKGLGAIHSLSHPLGALSTHRLHHGTLNAIFLPHVLRYNAQACPVKMQLMAKALGLSDAVELSNWFIDLTQRIGLPTRLGELGLKANDVEPRVDYLG